MASKICSCFHLHNISMFKSVWLRERVFCLVCATEQHTWTRGCVGYWGVGGGEGGGGEEGGGEGDLGGGGGSR